MYNLKSKEPRLRDWNLAVYSVYSYVYCDLEIKRTSITRLKHPKAAFRNLLISLEIKRTSITRLKLLMHCVHTELRNPWNQKNLDYEIETCRCYTESCYTTDSWNQKNLDYEIETCIWMRMSWVAWIWTWNQKNLDYEIETQTSPMPNPTQAPLKSKEPRLRDWNFL